MISVLDQISIVVRLVPMILHAFGLYLLVTVPSLNIKPNQMLLIMNLSVIEILLVFCSWIESLLRIILPHVTGFVYVDIVKATGVCFVYLATMTLITIDRFLEVYLNIRYSLYWSRKKMIMFITAIWILGSLATILITVAYHFYSIDYLKYCFIYFYPITEAIFLILSLLTYAYIFTIQLQW